MKTIFAALAAALTWFNTRGTQIDALKEEVKKRDDIIVAKEANIVALQSTVEAQAGDNKILNAALEDSKSKLQQSNADRDAAVTSLAEVNADIENATGQAQELITKVNENTAIPIQVGENGGVVHDEEHPANADAPAPAAEVPADSNATGTGAGTAGGEGK